MLRAAIRTNTPRLTNSLINKRFARKFLTSSFIIKPIEFLIFSLIFLISPYLFLLLYLCLYISSYTTTSTLKYSPYYADNLVK